MKNIVIIGAGISGLSAALTCLRHGGPEVNVTLVEKSPGPGGAVSVFKRGEYTIDTCQMIPDISVFTDYFGINPAMHELNPVIGTFFCADVERKCVQKILIPAGTENFMNMLAGRDETEKKQITRFMKQAGRIYDEIRQLKVKMNLFDAIRLAVKCPMIMFLSGKSFSGYLDMHGIKNSELRHVYDYFCSMTGLPQSKAASLLPVGVMFSLLQKAYRINPDFNSLAGDMASKISELGGKILYKNEAVSLTSERGRITGVNLKRGGHLDADSVISTVDAKITAEMMNNCMTDKIAKSEFMKKCRTMEMTGSCFSVYLGLDESFKPENYALMGGFQFLASGSASIEKIYSEFSKGKMHLTENDFQIGISWTRNEDEPGAVLTLSIVPVPFAEWNDLRKTDLAEYKAEKNRVSMKMIAIVEKHVIPDLSSHIRMKCTASPATFARYMGTSCGSIYDIASTKGNFGPSRISMYTPLKGLLMPKFAHGVFGALCSGAQAADALFGHSVFNGKAVPE